jgi:phage-related protein
MELTGNSVSIVNQDDGDREFKLENLPQSNEVIVLDGEAGVMTSSSGANLYPYCNFKFPRLVRGDNHVKITGKVKITFTCECPVMVGG